MSNGVDVSNSIGGNLQIGTSNKKAGEWSFEYSQESKSTCIKVQLENSTKEQSALGATTLESPLEKSDINQLIQWLYAVKSNME